MQQHKHNSLNIKVLNNGFTVILNEDHNEQKVFGLVITKAGGKNDPPDATGMAHYMEHMLFKGTTTLGTHNWEKEQPHIETIFKLYDTLAATHEDTKRAEIQLQINEESVKAAQYTILNEMSHLVHKMGGTKLNAFTSPDITVFFNEFPPNQITRWIDLYAHRFQQPVFRAFQSELEVVYEEKNMYEDQFQTKLIETFNKYMFKKHPYGQRSLIGTREDLKNPSLTKMYEFFKTWYVANNMALIISGDFNSSEIMPIIEDKFGALRKGSLPEKIDYHEPPIVGRELHVEKLSPIRINLIGYRTPAEGEADKPILDIICRMLSNTMQTGYFDQLAINNKILTAAAISMPYLDYGSLIIMSIPKVVGQSLEEAEKIVLEQIERIRKGDFTDEFLETIKNEFYREQQLKLESLQEKTLALALAFAKETDPNKVFKQTEIIQQITPQDIKRVATQYLGADYIVLQSKTGLPPNDKVTKPDFKPLITQTNKISEYQKHFNQIKLNPLQYKPIDFQKDIIKTELYNNCSIFKTYNSANDIFTLQINYCVGTETIKNLNYAVEYMNMTGIKDTDTNKLKFEFAKLGATYSFEVNEDYTTLHVEGIEKNLSKILQLLNKLLNHPQADNTKVKVIYENEKATRKVEQQEPEYIARALFEYALYGNRSKYIARAKLSEIKKFEANELIEIFKQATQYKIQMIYCGQTNMTTLETAIKNNLQFSKELYDTESPIYKQQIEYQDNIVLFTNKKKATQTKIFLTAQTTISPKEYAMIEAFNVYVGGGFSGILAQEIREYRSMAYAVSGGFKMPKKQNTPIRFTAQLGTQSDKAIEATAILHTLIRNMPQKEERIEMIKEYLISKSLTTRPSVRLMTHKVLEWNNRGYTSDPTPQYIEYYKNLTWQQLYNFYEQALKNNKYVMVIVGDKSRIATKKLTNYGAYTEISQNKLFTK